MLAPIGPLSGCVNLATYLKGILQTTIGIAGILAVIMIVICGIQMMASGSAGGKSAAKECITNAIFGVLLAIGSWLLLNTINPLLLKNTQALPDIAVLVTPPAAAAKIQPFPTEPGWYFRYKDADGNVKNGGGANMSAEQCRALLEQIKTTPGNSIENTPPPSAVNLSKSPAVPECWQVLAGSTPLAGDEKSARQSLCGNDSCVNQTPIGVNRPACRAHGDTGCTNVGGILPSAITAIKTLQTACSCNILITGGTESWLHAAAGTGSHAPGNGVFDLRWDGASSALATTIKSQNAAKPSFSGNMRWLYNGFWYTDEASALTRHWHVCPDGATPFYCKP
jgi:type IV secretory pathway VirB2 component (pilin)